MPSVLCVRSIGCCDVQDTSWCANSFWEGTREHQSRTKNASHFEDCFFLFFCGRCNTGAHCFCWWTFLCVAAIACGYVCLLIYFVVVWLPLLLLRGGTYEVRVKSSQIKPVQVKSSQIKSSQVESNQAKSSRVKSSQVKSSQIKSNQVKSSQILSSEEKRWLFSGELVLLGVGFVSCCSCYRILYILVRCFTCSLAPCSCCAFALLFCCVTVGVPLAEPHRLYTEATNHSTPPFSSPPNATAGRLCPEHTCSE